MAAISVLVRAGHCPSECIIYWGSEVKASEITDDARMNVCTTLGSGAGVTTDDE